MIIKKITTGDNKYISDGVRKEIKKFAWFPQQVYRQESLLDSDAKFGDWFWLEAYILYLKFYNGKWRNVGVERYQEIVFNKLKE